MTRALLIPITILATLVLLRVSQPVLVPLLLAGLVAQSLAPVVSRLERWVPRGLAIMVSLALVGAVMSMLVGVIGEQVSVLQKAAPDMQQRFVDLLASGQGFATQKFGIEPWRQVELLKQGLESMMGAGGQLAVSALGITVTVISDGALIMIFAFLLLYYRQHFRTHIVSLMSLHTKAGGANLIDSIIELGQKYVSGLLTVVALVGALDTLGLLISGAPYAGFFGLLGGMAVLIPYVGIIVVAPLCALLAWLATGKAAVAVTVLVVYAVVHMAEGNLITPYLIGHKVNLNPLTSILAVLVGGELWGPAGMLLFIPLAGMLQVAFELWPGAKPIASLLGNSPPEPGKQHSWLNLWRVLSKRKQ